MTMKASELTELGADELAEKMAEVKEELFNLRFQNVTGQLDNPNRLGEVRKDIARIYTVMRQRELAGDDAEGGREATTVRRGRRTRRS